MNTADLFDDPEGSKRSMKKTTLQRLQDDIQLQLKLPQQTLDVLKQYSAAHQLRESLRQVEAEQQLRATFDRASDARQMEEFLKNTSIAPYVQNLKEQSLLKSTMELRGNSLYSAVVNDAITDVVRRNDQYLKPLFQQQEWIEKFRNQVLGGLSIQSLSQQVEYPGSALAGIVAAKRSLDSLWGTFQGIDFSQFEVGDEDQNEAEQAAQLISEAATAEPDFKTVMNQIIGTIQAQQKPEVQLMLWLFFRKFMDWLIAGYIGAVISQQLAPTSTPPENPQQATKEIKRAARRDMGSLEFLTDFRFVSVKTLIVRQSPKASSPHIGSFSHGTLVRLLKKEKDFALVVWSDHESGGEVQGWVFSRYLQKFN